MPGSFPRTTQTLLALYAGGFTQACLHLGSAMQLTKTRLPDVLPGKRGVRPRGPSVSGAGVRKLSGSGLDFQGWSQQTEMMALSYKNSIFWVCQVRAEEQRVGRFYYRPSWGSAGCPSLNVGICSIAQAPQRRKPRLTFSTGVTQFWDKLFEDNGKGLLTEPNVKYEMCVMVTHGLTIRLMLMCLFKWSVETFASVWNLGNCEHVTLKKNVQRA